MADKKVIDYKERQTVTEVADFLQNLSQSMLEGKVAINKGGQVEYSVAKEIELEIKVEEDGSKREVEIELEWAEE